MLFLDKRVLKLSEKDRKIGHRRINEEGEVSYKKIHSNQLIASIQLGIQVNDNFLARLDFTYEDLVFSSHSLLQGDVSISVFSWCYDEV